jgi:HD-GYP domain-containing protein (c-di-GMP phosphodiesterase class II)
LAELVRSRLERSLTLDATIDGWSHALALRDEDTSAHTERVTELVTRLSRRIGLPEDMINVLRRGARLHDIGKMGIPDKILLKPGPLDDDDWMLMQKHPLFAFEMLHAIPFVAGALDVPYCHHERWDGTGYPRGLKGDNIPLLTRIFSVVDVWDALCSDRPYRPAWPRSRAIQYLVEQSGRQFDPYMITAFLDMIHAPDVASQS